MNSSPTGDWGYFNSLPLFIRSVLFHYKDFIFHDPWMCGGLDILSNPQSRIFSPTAILDLLFEPYHANIVSLMFQSFVGLLGAYAMARRLELSSSAAFLFAFLFISSSYFGLHFAAGHVTYASLQLLPLSLYLLSYINDRKVFLAYLLLHCFFILDGGIYTFIFSLYAGLTAITIGIFGLSFQNIRKLLSDTQFFLISIFSALLLVSPKIVPVILGQYKSLAKLENTIVSFSDLFSIFLYPFQKINLYMHTFAQFYFHEFGNYIGFGQIILFVFACFKLRKKSLALVLAVVFWYWAALGWGDVFNPWTLHQFSAFNSAHVQSRLFIIGNIFFLILVVKGLEFFQKKRIFFAIFSILLMVEALFVKNYPFLKALEEDSFVATYPPIKNQTIVRTLKEGQKPQDYYALNSGSKSCYEPSFTLRKVKASSDSNYLGEAYSLTPGSTVHLLKYTPGRIEVEVSGQVPTTFEVNTNHLLGWSAKTSGASVLSKKGELLRVATNNTGKVTLQYSPLYMPWIIFTWLLGIILFLILFFKNRQKEGAKRFNYEKFPPGFYQDVAENGHAIRRAWHLQKFERVISFLPQEKDSSILDIGCFAGTFLSLIPESHIQKQVGVDILETQIKYANQRFESSFRKFFYIENISKIKLPQNNFRFVSAIELIEHLDILEIKTLFERIDSLLISGGWVILTTPNYQSPWPIIEYLLNRFSDVSYEEQHLTKFNYFNIYKKLNKICPDIMRNYTVKMKTTSHLLAPFLGIISFELAMKASRFLKHDQWRFPFGNLIILVLEKKK